VKEKQVFSQKALAQKYKTKKSRSRRRRAEKRVKELNFLTETKRKFL